MADDDTERFDILFAGECLAGHDAVTVRGAMANLFRADDATLDRLFSGQRQRIKRGVDRATALKYQKAMQAAGARAIVQRAGGEAESISGDRAGRLPQASMRPAAAAGTTLSLDPTGADLLRPGERSRPDVAPPATEHLSVAEVGDRLSNATATAAPTVEAPAFEIAATGSDLSEPSAEATPPAPDTSSIALTEGDFDLSDCHPPPTAPLDLDLTHLNVAACGADLLREDERPHEKGHIPDTSHLRIEGDDAT